MNKVSNNDCSSSLHLLLMGPLPIEGDVIGGTKVLFNDLVSYFSENADVTMDIINISRPRNKFGRILSKLLDIYQLVVSLFLVFKKIRSSDIFFVNMSPGALMMVGWFLYLVSKFFGKPIVMRVFGGDFDNYFDGANKVLKYLNRLTVLRCDLLVLETKALCSRLSTAANVFWLPNSRDIRFCFARRKRCRRFIFVGQIRKEKGVFELLRAFKGLPSCISLSLFGDMLIDTETIIKNKPSNVTFGGKISIEDLPNVLADHDALILPTYYEGEGYPGVIIEAMQMGLPVISTVWKAIPEIVTNGKEGILVPPKDSDSLIRAISYLCDKDEDFKEFSENAQKKGEEFRTGKVLRQLLDRFEEITN